MEHFDILIIGAGAAGIAAAKGACSAGCKRIALVDRKKQMGGVLLQCAHRGFDGTLTGPEYTKMLLQGFPEEVVFYGDTMVLSVSQDRIAHLSGGKTIAFRQLILATGCREIPIGALPIVGSRPEGVYTAGQMQEMMNLYGEIPEGPVVILGSGDLGLIMARQLAEKGISVTMVEQRPTCGGMARNQRCLKENPIRLLCSDTIAEVLGEKELEGCITQNRVHLPCKTLLIAAGLRPERELVQDLQDPDWLHICGNCSHVHPMVEAVVAEGKHAGITAWETIRGKL